jgi:hypothetical protein
VIAHPESEQFAAKARDVFQRNGGKDMASMRGEIGEVA